MRISDWSSDVCSSDLIRAVAFFGNALPNAESKTFIIGPGDEIDDACHCVGAIDRRCAVLEDIGARKRGDWDHVEVRRAVGARAARDEAAAVEQHARALDAEAAKVDLRGAIAVVRPIGRGLRSEEHTSELQSLMRISNA